jgi:hypothetical protein
VSTVGLWKNAIIAALIILISYQQKVHQRIWFQALFVLAFQRQTAVLEVYSFTLFPLTTVGLASNKVLMYKMMGKRDIDGPRLWKKN